MNKSDTEDNQQQLLEEYGITCSTKTIYHYQGYSYERLKDALTYAEIDRKRNLTASGDHNIHETKKPGQ